MGQVGLMPFRFDLLSRSVQRSQKAARAEAERLKTNTQTDQLGTERGRAQGLNTQEGNQGQVQLIGAVTKDRGDKDRREKNKSGNNETKTQTFWTEVSKSQQMDFALFPDRSNCRTVTTS